MLTPFFVSRGDGQLTTKTDIDNYVNIIFQSIYNYHDWQFKNLSEKLESEPYGEGLKKWKLSFDIDRPIEILDEHGSNLIPTFKVLNENKIYQNYPEDQCNIGKDYIITSDKIEKIQIQYIIAYEFFTYSEMKNQHLPIPDKFIPAAMHKIYDLASPLAYFDDDNIIPRYQAGERELIALKNIDGISADMQFMPGFN